MLKKPTWADATLILKLYDLRREAEIRKARNWWLADFWPETADDFMKIAQALGTRENNWLRQREPESHAGRQKYREVRPPGTLPQWPSPSFGLPTG